MTSVESSMATEFSRALELDPMSIGLVCPYNMSRGGAVQQIVRDMRSELVNRGHEVKIVTGRPDDPGDLESEDGVVLLGHVKDLPIPGLSTLGSITKCESRDAQALIAREDFDIIHFHEPGVPSLGRRILEHSRSVNVATFHASLPDSRPVQMVARGIRPYLRKLYSNLDGAVAVSEVAKVFPSSVTDQPIQIIPNAVDLSSFTAVERTEPGTPKRLLYLGRLEKRKGVGHLLRAYQLLASEVEGVSLDIAGAGPDKEELESLTRSLDLPNVSFHGFVSDEERLNLLHKADLFCAPALFGESFGVVLIEAMATGLIAVAGDNPGYRSVMKEKGVISLVDPTDSYEFAQRMKMLLLDEPLRIMMRTWALEYVKQFDYKTVMNQYEALYRRALANKR